MIPIIEERWLKEHVERKVKFSHANNYYEIIRIESYLNMINIIYGELLGSELLLRLVCCVGFGGVRSNSGEGCLLWRRGLFCHGCSVLCSGTERISKAGWLRNSLRKPDGEPSDSPWQRLPLCHKQNTRRLSLLPTPTRLARCQAEQSVSQPRLPSSSLARPLALPPVSYNINKRAQLRLYLCERNNEDDV